MLYMLWSIFVEFYFGIRWFFTTIWGKFILIRTQRRSYVPIDKSFTWATLVIHVRHTDLVKDYVYHIWRKRYICSIFWKLGLIGTKSENFIQRLTWLIYIGKNIFFFDTLSLLDTSLSKLSYKVIIAHVKIILESTCRLAC